MKERVIFYRTPGENKVITEMKERKWEHAVQFELELLITIFLCITKLKLE